MAITQLADVGEWANYEADGEMTFAQLRQFAARFPQDYFVWVVAQGQLSTRYVLSAEQRGEIDPDEGVNYAWRTVARPIRVGSLQHYRADFVRHVKNDFAEVDRFHIKVTEVYPG